MVAGLREQLKTRSQVATIFTQQTARQKLAAPTPAAVAVLVSSSDVVLDAVSAVGGMAATLSALPSSALPSSVAEKESGSSSTSLSEQVPTNHHCGPALELRLLLRSCSACCLAPLLCVPSVQVRAAITEYALGSGELRAIFDEQCKVWDDMIAARLVQDACQQIGSSVEKRREAGYSLTRNGVVNEARVSSLRKYLVKLVLKRAASRE